MLYGKKAIVFAAVMLFVEWLQREKEHALQLENTFKILNYRPVRWGIYVLILLIIKIFTGQSQTFIYFQF